MSERKKKFIPFSNPGSVVYLNPLEDTFLESHKIPEEYLHRLKSKRLAKIFLFSLGGNCLQFYPIFRELGFEPFTIEPPQFPSKFNYDQNESYLLYAKSLSSFLIQLNRKDIFIFYPEADYSHLVHFLMSAYLLADENIQEDELIEYFFEEDTDLKTIQKNFRDMRNFLYGEYYLTYLSTKTIPEVHLQIERTLQIENESPVYRKQETPLKVELISTENNIPYELNLNSLSQKFTPAPEKTEEMTFNLSSLTPKEFSPESDEDGELLENLLEMADSFETKIADNDVLNLDTTEDEEKEEEPAPFLTLKQIPKHSPNTHKPEIRKSIAIEDWEDIVSIDLPEPELPMDSFIIDDSSFQSLLEDPIFKKDITPSTPHKKEVKKIPKNFLGLPEDW